MSGLAFFARCCAALESSGDPVEAVTRLLDALPPDDVAWAVYLLAGGRPLRPALPAAVVQGTARQASGLPDWLFDASLQAAGDVAQTLALAWAMPPGPMSGDGPGLADWIGRHLRPLQRRGADEQIAGLLQAWQVAGSEALEVAVQLCGSRARRLVTIEQLQQALAQHAGLPLDTLARRWDGWLAGVRKTGRPDDAAAWQALLAPPDLAQAPAPEPLPAWPGLTSSDAPGLGTIDDWRACPDRHGIRLLLVRHPAETRLWADGSRLLDTVFPDVLAELARLDGACMIEAEVLSAPRAGLPATVLLHDLLSLDGEDLRGWPWERRLERLARWRTEGRGAGLPASWMLAEAQPLSSWQQAGGMLLKRRSAVYADEGACWRVAAPPTVVTALLLHAQAGSGRDAGLYVDCTLAVWNRRPVDAAEAQAVIEAIARQAPRGASGTDLELLPLGRTSEGLDEAGRRQVDRLVRAGTVARHGPVRSLRPEQVVDLAFDGLEPSPRRRSGVALRAPRLLGLRDDLAAHEVADLATLLSSMKA